MQTIEHISAEAIERYLALASAPGETLRMQTHVAGCEVCRQKLAGAVDADRALAALRSDFAFDDSASSEPEHLPYEQLALFVDGRLDEVEQEIAESHLAICAECAADFADLRLFRRIATENEAGAAVAGTEKRSFWQRSFAFERFGGAVTVAAGAFAVLIAVLFAVWFFAKTNQSNSANQLAQTNPNQIASPSPQPPVLNGAQNNPVDNSIQNANDRAANGAPNSPSNSSNPNSSKTQPAPPQPRTSEIAAPMMALSDNGKSIGIDAEGRLNGAEGIPDSARAAVQRSLKAQRANVPRALEAISNAQTGVLMSGSNDETDGVPFALVSPVGKVTRETQPVLRWRALPNAKHYVVAVVDADFRVVAQSPPLKATEWKIDKSLPRGANYSWQVTAVGADGGEKVSPASPAPPARFRTMEQAAFDDVTRIETGNVKSHLTRGVVYAQAGLVDEAQTEFTRLVKENPRSRLAQRLLDSVRKK